MTQWSTWTPAQSGSWRPPAGGYSGGYFDPTSLYGGQQYWQPNGQATPFWEGVRYHYLQDNPNAVYSMFTSPFAGGLRPFDSWMRQQEGQTQDAYAAALANNPDLTYQQFLGNLGPEYFQNRFNQMAPSQRGVQPGSFGGGRVQWLSY